MAMQGTSGVPRGLHKKLIDDPRQVVDEALEGFVGAHSGLVALAGYVGREFADATACGNVFVSPSRRSSSTRSGRRPPAAA
jgi:dihydroxyacetone kinase